MCDNGDEHKTHYQRRFVEATKDVKIPERVRYAKERHQSCDANDKALSIEG